MPAPVLLVGYGKMGRALLSGWLDTGRPPGSLAVVEPDPAARAAATDIPELTVAETLEALPDGARPAVVVLAVKPQTMDEVAPAYRRFDHAVYLSIAAGRTLTSFARLLGEDAAVVRAMPNTPAAVHRGISAACAGARVTPEQRELCAALLAAVGEVVWVDDESLLDAVTAVSGSGPAYVFLLTEALADAGIAAGLPPDLAARLAAATVAGAGELMRQSDDPPAVLRRNVTSPGGTTEAALEVLMAAPGLPGLVLDAVAAATRRSRDLAG